MEKTGRNEPCPCGSGKKYKNCHQQQENFKEGRNKSIIIGSLIAAFIILAAMGFYLKSQSSTAPENAPKGKVWSQEHGHWHDAE